MSAVLHVRSTFLGITYESRCPNSDDIFPCKCLPEDDTIDCSEVGSEEELAQAFSANFPSLNFNMLTIVNNTNLMVLRDGTFGNATFQVVHIRNGVLEEIEPNALSASFSTAHELMFTDNNITKFPFQILPMFTRLSIMNLNGNNLQEFPKIESKTLQWIELGFNPLGHMPNNSFLKTPSLVLLHLPGVQLEEIIPGTLANLPHLEYVTLANNYLTRLPEDTVVFTDSHALLNFAYNNISTVSVGAFRGMTSGTVYVSYNQLETLDEEVWRPLLELEIFVEASGNPLICGCDVAWLARNVNFLFLFSYNTMCIDGTYLRDLDPASFEQC